MVLQVTGGAIARLLERIGVPAEFAGSIDGAISFLVALVVVYAVGRAVVLPLVERLLDARDLDRHARAPLLKVTWFAIVFAAVAIAFGLAGFGSFLQSLATIAAAATLAIGLAMQDVLRNLVAGVFIFTDRPFRIGDWIEWDDHAGTVEDISLRVTRVRTFDNELLTVPNSQLTDGVIKNPVDADRLLLRVVFGISYDDDVDEATEIILEAARDHEDVLAEPAPSVRLTELADSSVGLQARIWIADPSRSDFVRTRAEYVSDVKSRFDDAGVEFPFPQRDLTGSIELVDGRPEAGGGSY